MTTRCTFQIVCPSSPAIPVERHDAVGNVVGIVSDRLSDSAALETTGMLAQNVNYAVKCDSVASFLGAFPEVLAKLKSPYRSKDRKSKDVLKEAQDAARRW